MGHMQAATAHPLKRPVPLLAALALVACTASPTTTPGPSIASSELASEQASASASVPAEPAEHRIGVRVVDGDGEFFDRLTGETFVARGSNLIRLDDYHNTLSPGHYRPTDLDRQLGRMAALGYNVVRVFHDQRVGGLGQGGGPGLSAMYLDNAADFLRLAKAHGIYVMFTQDWLPDSLAKYVAHGSPGIADINAGILAPGGVRANVRFFGDFVEELIARDAPLDAIWAYELRNELFFDANQPPFSLRSGQVTAANGETYDMADPDQRRQLLEDGLVYWTDAVRAEILRHDPTALVGVGFFVPQGPNPTRPGDPRIIETRQAIAASTADFIDVHGYPGADIALPLHLENFGLDGPVPKPIVMGEMGTFRNDYPVAAEAAQALVNWQAASCAYGLDGWMIWTWDAASYTQTWNGTDADGTLNRALAPTERPDPCSGANSEAPNLALAATVTTSAEIAGSAAAAAVDGSLGAIWNSGGYPPQWLELSLASVAPAGSEIRLTVAQSPGGASEHRLYGGPTADALVLLNTFAGVTADGDQLRFVLGPGAPAVQVLRIETVSSPSWVAWREVQVLPPP